MGSQWNATWSLDSLVGWNDGELEKTLDHRNSYCMKWSLAYETLWNQAILTSNIFAQNLYWRSQGAIAGTGSMPPWHDRLDKPAVTWCSYYWTIAIISKLRPDMISSLEKDPTFPHQTTSQRSQRSAVSLWPRSIRSSALELRRFATRDSRDVQTRPFSQVLMGWGRTCRELKALKAFNHSNDNVETGQVSHWQLNLSIVNKLFRRCWTLLYLQRRSSSSLFWQGLCPQQIRMRVMNPLRAGPQFAEACFSNAKTFKAAKSPQVRPCMPQGLPKNARSQAQDLTEPWHHEIPPHFCIFFAIEIRTRRASTILRPDLNLDRH